MHSAEYDVLIIGSGPVGLATAIGLLNAGVPADRIAVLEKARAYQPVGNTLDLLPNAMKALRGISAEAADEVEQYSTEALEKMRQAAGGGAAKKRTWETVDLDGELLNATPLDNDYMVENFGTPRCSLPWHKLQEILLARCPPGLVRTAVRVSRLEDLGEDWVVAHCEARADDDSGEAFNSFANWNQAAPSAGAGLAAAAARAFTVRARIVVGADGIHSTARTFTTPEAALPEYSGTSTVYCRNTEPLTARVVEALSGRYLAPWRTTFFIQGYFKDRIPEGFSARFMINMGAAPGVISYIVSMPLEEPIPSASASPEVQSFLVERLRSLNFPEPLVDLVASSQPDAFSFRNLFVHRVESSDPRHGSGSPPWHRARVVLAGDSAHAMPPFRAQGTAQGLCDAVAIVRRVAEGGRDFGEGRRQNVEEWWKGYEAERKPVVEEVQYATFHVLDGEAGERYQNSVWGRVPSSN